MSPIDKIEWGKNRDKEEALLEYVSILEQIYISDFDYDNDDPFYEGYTTIKESDISPEEWEDMANQSAFIDVSDILQTFADRYNKGIISEHFNYDSYIKNELIQNFIKDLELDANMFWFLILFIYDYSHHYCIDGIDMGDSPNEQLITFVKTILMNAESFDEKAGTTFTKPMTLRISADGERDIIIDNPTAIHYIADSTYKFMEQDNISTMGIMSHKRKLDSSTPIKDSPYITYFAKMFFTFFDTQTQLVEKRKKGSKHSQKETDLVCQLIAFTKISLKACWGITENETLRPFLRQYKDFKPATKNSVYPSFRM